MPAAKAKKDTKARPFPSPGPGGLPNLTPPQLAIAVGTPPFPTPRRSDPSGAQRDLQFDAIGNEIQA